MFSVIAGTSGAEFWVAPCASTTVLPSTYMRWHRPHRAHSHPSEP